MFSEGMGNVRKMFSRQGRESVAKEKLAEQQFTEERRRDIAAAIAADRKTIEDLRKNASKYHELSVTRAHLAQLEGRLKNL
ncbi:hypothetical protein GYA54_00275 [Candidatus Kuenenbacteria bacterium]|nr:hypothetical protein [Candidatus Kuenenbacteria bacterium]